MLANGLEFIEDRNRENKSISPSKHTHTQRFVRYMREPFVKHPGLFKSFTQMSEHTVVRQRRQIRMSCARKKKKNNLYKRGEEKEGEGNVKQILLVREEENLYKAND